MKHMRRFTALVLALVMVFGLTVSASAANTVTVKLSPNITVTLEGEPQAMVDVNGNPVYPVLYGGTTYLPVRAVGNMLGVEVKWDQATQTVLLSDPEDGAAPAKPSVKAPTDAKPTDITVQINPNIKVTYNGVPQKMRNVNGDRVYPMLYGGTTYLPVRAVSNMLYLTVDWDQTTQTVKLSNRITRRIAFPNEDGTETVVDLAETEAARKALKAQGWADEFIERAVNGPKDARSIHKLFEDIVHANDDDGGDYSYTDMHAYTAPDGRKVEVDAFDTEGARDILAWAGFPQDEIDRIIFDLENPDYFGGQKTSEDAKVLGDKHVGYSWGEVDYSTANKGYVLVKIDKDAKICDLPIVYANCVISSHSKTDGWDSFTTRLSTNRAGWQKVPLTNPGSEQECVLRVWVHNEFSMTGPEDDPTSLEVRFTAEVDNPDSVWLLSHLKIDYENAPNACAKAKEITKNCTTDAEKITAVYNWVHSNITYDRKLFAEIEAWNTLVKDDKTNMFDQFKDGARAFLALDNILVSKSGVCEDYATLMAGMLRSIGVPCKVVSGNAVLNSDGKWVPHAWVAVKPETGTLNISGAGKDYAGYDENTGKPTDPTGWIRLDPTNAHIPNVTSNDNNYKTRDYR